MSTTLVSLRATLVASAFSPLAATAICTAWIMLSPLISPEDASVLGSFNLVVPFIIASISYLLVLTIGTLAHGLLLALGLNQWWSYAIMGFIGAMPLWLLVSDPPEFLYLLWMSTISVPTAISYWWVYNHAS